MHARRIALTAALGAMTLALTAPVFGGVAVAATERTVVVTESDITRQAEGSLPLDNWVLYNRADGNGAFRYGPAQPPLGAGSFELSTPTGADKATLFNYDHIGTDLDSIDAMSYSTYRSAGSELQVAAINIQVDVNGAAPGGFTSLVFEPVYNTNQGAIISGEWQNWDAYSGGQAIWWSSNPIPGAPNRDTFVPWDTIAAANPDAVIVGGYGLNQGSGNPALVTATDALRLSHGKVDVTYDFEFDPSTDKDQCKDGGYLEFSNPSFKNQGECVSYQQRGDKGSDGGGSDPSSVPAAKLAALSLLG